MKELWKYFESDFYTVMVSFILAVTGFIISLKKNKQNRKLKPLIFFFLGYILNQVISGFNIEIGLPQPLRSHIFFYGDFIDTIIEFLAFFFFIKNYIVSVKIRKILNPVLPIGISSMLIYFAYYKITHAEIDQYFLQIVFTIQAFLLLVACIFYYVDLFTKEPKLMLTEDPSFWVVTGVAFFMLCTFPFSIFGLYLIKANYHLYVQLFVIFEVFYWILFLMIIKAYFCKPERADDLSRSNNYAA
jgi:hypothetical protein